MSAKITDPAALRRIARIILTGRREAPAATAEAPQMAVPDGAQDGGRYVS